MKRLVVFILYVFFTTQSFAANLVLYNGKIVTVDAGFSIQTAIAIEGDRIVQVGGDDAILKLAGPNSQKIDLKGKTVIPGLIDSHAHIMRTAEHWSSEVRLDGIDSRQKALEMLASKGRERGKGQWVTTTGGFSPSQFKDNNSPFTLQELDKALPNNPVLLQHLFGMAYVNTQAFRMIEIDEDTDIAWLEIANDIDMDDDEQPVGVVRGAAMRRMQATYAQVDLSQHMSRAKKLNQYLNRLGLTSVIDAAGGTLANPYNEVYSALDKKGELSLRVFHLLPAPNYALDQVGEFSAFLKTVSFFEKSDYFQRIGIGERLYGPVHDSMAEPAANSPEHQKAFAALARQIAEAGLHLHQHATLNQSINQHLDAYEKISQKHDLAKLRWTFTHVDDIDRATIERAKKLEMMMAAQSRRLIGGKMFEHFLPSLAFADPPLHDLEQSGIRWGLGTDAMTASQLSPFLTLWWAVTGKSINGEQLTDQVVDRKQALIAHTRDNAWFAFRENDLGSLEAGKLADLLVLDRDYLNIPINDIKLIKPLMTIVGGEVVYQN